MVWANVWPKCLATKNSPHIKFGSYRFQTLCGVKCWLPKMLANSLPKPLEEFRDHNNHLSLRLFGHPQKISEINKNKKITNSGKSKNPCFRPHGGFFKTHGCFSDPTVGFSDPAAVFSDPTGLKILPVGPSKLGCSTCSTNLNKFLLENPILEVVISKLF